MLAYRPVSRFTTTIPARTLALSSLFRSVIDNRATMLSATLVILACLTATATALVPVPQLLSPGDGQSGAAAIVSSDAASYVCLTDGRVQRVDQSGHRLTVLDTTAAVSTNITPSKRTADSVNKGIFGAPFTLCASLSIAPGSIYAPIRS